MFRSLAVISTILIALTGCQAPEPDATVTAPEPASPTTTQAAAGTQPAVLSEGFSTPESVLYDAEQDVYFVSNINGSPVGDDDNGYISRVNAETLQVEAKWIDGAADSVTLSAPKGMAIVGDELWVTDVTRIVRFDRRTGQQKSSFKVPGASFLNDLVADTRVYVSDTGVKLDASGGFAPTGSDAIWEVTDGKPRPLVRGSELNRPNGLALRDGNVWAVTFGAAELFSVRDGKKGEVTTLPAGSLDGMIGLQDGSVLVSSWDAKTIYRGQPNGTFEAVIQDVESPADLGYDAKRNRVLVPHFMENRVSIHTLQ